MEFVDKIMFITGTHWLTLVENLRNGLRFLGPVKGKAIDVALVA